MADSGVIGLLLNQTTDVVAVVSDRLQVRLPTAKIIDLSRQPEMASTVQYVLAWKTDTSLLSRLTNIKLIQSYGAGVDHLPLADIHEAGIRICRFMSDTLSSQMTEYVLTRILADQQHLFKYRGDQSDRIWQPEAPRQGRSVCILGLGKLGAHLAQTLVSLGYQVTGWSRNGRPVPRVTIFSGHEGLAQVARHADYIVNLLPLTDQTRGCIGSAFFKNCKPLFCYINAGRADTQDENAVKTALDNGDMRKLVQDVFSAEPLPLDHWMWTHLNVEITPHAASLTDSVQVADYFADNILHDQNGLDLTGEVEPGQSY